MIIRLRTLQASGMTTIFALGFIILSAVGIGIIVSLHSLFVLLLLAVAVIITLGIIFIERFNVAIFLLVLSFPFEETVGSQIFGFLLSPSRIIIPIVVVAWLAKKMLSRRKREQRLDLSGFHKIALLFLVWVLLSVMFSAEPLLSIQALVRLVPMWLGAIVIVESLVDRQLIWLSLASVCVGIAIIALFGLWEFMQSPAEYMSLEARLEGISDQSNRTAHTVAVAMPLLLCILHVNRKHRKLLLGLVVISLFTILLTNSRGGMLATIAGIVVFYRLNIRWVMGIFALMAILTVPMMENLTESFMERSVDRRIQVQLAALDTGFTYPVTGLGLGTFVHQYRLVDGFPYSLMQPIHKTEGRLENIPAHNLFSHILAEMGVIALFIFMCFWVLIFRGLLQSERVFFQNVTSSQNWSNFWLARGLTASAASFLMSRMAITSFSELFTWLWIAILIGSVSYLSRQRNRVEFAASVIDFSAG
jgi:O-antigen ligase